jgi:hypothetical protein
MSHITAHVRLRPVRFAFLVRPDDKKQVDEIFRVSTCLWGGKFNPIIPIFKQVPSWWDRNNHRFESARQIINGYLDFFEPDFLVEASPGLAEGLGFNPERILPIAEILTREGDRDREGHGLSVLDLYENLYRKEFRFVSRKPHDIVNVVADQLAFSSFSACLFGAFPQSKGLQHFGKAYEEVFSPQAVSLNGSVLADLFKSGFTTALRIGHSYLDVEFHNREAPALFILDATQPRDLIDYWNLRAVRNNVLPIPVQWLPDLSAFCKAFIVRNYRPLPGNPNGVMIQPTVMFARSITNDQLEPQYTQHLKVDVEGANMRQDWYPSIWRPTPNYTVEQSRPQLSALEKSSDIPVNSEAPQAQFDSLNPEFASEYGNKHRWVNVVKLRDWTNKNQIAIAYPTNYRDPKFPEFRLGREELLPTTEGFVVFPSFRNLPERWELPEGTSAIAKWLQKHGISSTPSEAGRITQQIIQTLGGFWGVSSFAHPEIVKLLNDISRRPSTKSIQHQEFRNRIKQFIKGDLWRHRNFENLVERKAVELGLELHCTKCSNWGWYSLKQLDHRMTCDLCLREFDFPIVEPSIASNSKWAYRLIGPFALPDYARGGYAASLSIRFFSELVGFHDSANVTWSGGLELNLPDKRKVEADFILWFQRRRMFGNDRQTEIVFGESKSFGLDAFQADDIDRMKILATQFPGSVLVFSTMKLPAELSPGEIQRLTKLAMWGREYVSERRQSRAPVIILTGIELFATFSVSSTWRQLGGKHAELIQPGWVRTDSLRSLADLTQQLYLGMPSYSEWREEKWKKRKDARDARAVKAKKV